MANNTPETEFENPNDFYTKVEAKRYDSNSGMKKAQTELTNIILNLFLEETKNYSKDISILDIGCGTGFSLEFFKAIGYNNLEGIEPAKEMLLLSKEKGFSVLLGGFEDIPKVIKNRKYDLIISISALQWILANKQDMEIKNKIKTLGKDLKSMLKEKGWIFIQYYPPRKEMSEILISSFQRVGLNAEEYLYNKGNPKKEKHILILKHK
ncbi:MAG TPA: methyltransferase domain-containing protein [archaeon]|nr:methyltransferase domain-containing protein [archaeon]HPV66351.1 methyltransferase domain-containing protein [archaeon]